MSASPILTSEQLKDMSKCPNCGDLHFNFDLNHTATKNITVPLGDNYHTGSISSTLYGVCATCAENFKNS